MPAKHVPEGYHSLTPYIICDGAAAALDYYKKAFGAEERMRFAGPGGKIMHAEITVAGSIIMLADEFPEMGAVSPKRLGGTPFGLCLYVPDCDKVFNQAVAAGGKAERPVVNQFYGDRSGTLVDPFGHKWTVSTHVEDVPPDEMKKRMESYTKQGGGDCSNTAAKK
jgi:PhnB protein